ncbi:NADH-quinone oxidoreductase subunit NuoN [Nocardioidaceae bacterium SCSIO 66511]|nr:NADH-quinone oxidoreductase subunit NuoN [Nocardioidaceae bacterium SCSIO 66511]
MSSALLAAPPDISGPSIEYSVIYPVLIVFGAAFVGVMLEAFAPRKVRYFSQLVVTLIGLIAAFVGTIQVAAGLDETSGGAASARGKVVAEGALAVDGPTVFIWGLVLILAFVSMLLFAERRLEGGLTAFAGQAAAIPGTEAEREDTAQRVEQTEIFPLALFAIGGMMVFPASNDLITMFIALEVLSLPLYVLCGMARRRRLLSQEAAMKYFLLGAFASAFFLYGIALTYGYAGSLTMAGIADAVASRSGGHNLLLAGIGLLAVGTLFKVSAAPFHAWTPDVYQGAPTAVTGFMAACTKVAGFGALLRIFFVAFGDAQWDWRPMLWIIAGLTMVIGSLVAIAQTDMKRMLAYSSVAHAGFLLVGVAGAVGVTADYTGITSIESVLFYLATYGFPTIGAFAIVTLVRDAGGEATHLSRWAGLGKESPLLACIFAFFLLAFAGIPLTSGFMGKWAVFGAAWAGDAWLLVVIGVLMSAVAAFFYVRVIVLMFFQEPTGEGPTVAVPSYLTSVVLAVTVAVTIVLGIVPGPVLELAQHAGAFVR